MPSTYNGIGTHYYGKKNVQRRTGTCRSCGRTVELVSYDTRLWFVVVFIPVIPIARKHIIDYCPVCRRHYAAEADKWETAKQLETSGAQEKFRADPTADNAIAAHQQLLNFHQIDQAADFQKTMMEKFPDNAKIQAYLGAAMMHIGRLADAEPFFTKALALRPDLPEARIGVARAHIRAGRLDEARALLDFLEIPGAAKLYSLEPLDVLARAYQNVGRNREALEIFKVVLRELPKLGEAKWFRKLVAKSETSGQESILPKLRFSWKRFFSIDRSRQQAAGPRVTWRGLKILGIVLGVVAIIMVIANEFVRRQRTLYVVSGFATPALVQVDGAGEVRVRQNMATLTLTEGHHHATITGPVNQEMDFDVRAGYWSRWFSHPVWVLNVGGSAILDRVDATYRENPEPVQHTFYFGDAFFALDGIAYQFKELPKQQDAGTHLASLNLFEQAPADLFYYYAQKHNFSDAFRLAETSLRAQPDDQILLDLYFSTAREQNQLVRAEIFLSAGLTNRPVQIQWHRYYQDIHRDAAHNAQMAAMYDADLQKDPANSALLYLRGRVCTDRDEGRAWFQRACDADPKNPYPFYALGYDHTSVGDWAGARPLLAHASEVAPKRADFAAAFNLARLALGEYEALEKDLRSQLAREPLNYPVAHELCDTLIGEGNPGGAGDFVRQFEAAAAKRDGEFSREPNIGLTYHFLYATKDFAGLKSSSAGDNSPDGRYAQFTALVELGQLDEAAKLFPLEDKTVDNPFYFLNMAIAYRLAGNLAESERYLARVKEIFTAASSDMARAAAALSETETPPQVELEAIALRPDDKASLLVALAQLHPESRATFAKEARALNVNRDFPYHLIDRATAE